MRISLRNGGEESERRELLGSDEQIQDALRLIQEMQSSIEDIKYPDNV